MGTIKIGFTRVA